MSELSILVERSARIHDSVFEGNVEYADGYRTSAMRPISPKFNFKIVAMCLFLNYCYPFEREREIFVQLERITGNFI